MSGPMWFLLLALSSVWHIQLCMLAKRSLNYLFVEGLWCTDVSRAHEWNLRSSKDGPTGDAGSCFLSGAQTKVTFWLSSEVLQYDWPRALLRAPSPCSAWLWYKVRAKPAVYHCQNNVPSCSTNRETHNSEMSFAEVSPFLWLPCWSVHQAEVPFITLPQPPSSPQPLQLQQKRPERVTKAHQLHPSSSHQTLMLPPPEHREERGRFLQLQSLEVSFLFQDDWDC